jgi:hypothetical protein
MLGINSQTSEFKNLKWLGDPPNVVARADKLIRCGKSKNEK